MRLFRSEQAAVWEALDVWEPAPVSVDFNRKLWRRIDAAAADPGTGIWRDGLGSRTGSRCFP